MRLSSRPETQWEGIVPKASIDDLAGGAIRLYIGEYQATRDDKQSIATASRWLPLKRVDTTLTHGFGNENFAQ